MAAETANGSSLEEKLEAVEKSVGELFTALHFLCKENREEAVYSLAAIQQNLVETMMVLAVKSAKE